MSQEKFDLVMTGPRMEYAVARALARNDMLSHLHTDIKVSGWAATHVARSPGHRKIAGRLSRRVATDIPAERITGHPTLLATSLLRRRLVANGRSTLAVDRQLSRIFRRIAKSCESRSVFGLSANALELFESRELCLLEQFCNPAEDLASTLRGELRKYPKWSSDTPHNETGGAERWAARMKREWDRADAIYVPSDHVATACAEAGASIDKFVTIPYPSPSIPDRLIRVRSFNGDRPLRVIFAGAVSLAKGVHYLASALSEFTEGLLDVHIFGQAMLSPYGLRRLEDVAVLHGAVPFDALLREMYLADLLIHPSLSEGSALVTLQAAATGLPVIATFESGAPPGSLLVHSRNASALVGILQEILDTPTSINKLSAAALDWADGWGEMEFAAAIRRFTQFRGRGDKRSY